MAGGLLGAFNSFFGGNATQNPYGGQINSYLGAAGQQGRNIAGMGQQAANTYNQFSPQANQYTENYLNYLGQNPYTNTVDAQLLNNQSKGTTNAYQQARSQLLADTSARGMNNSGYTAGSLADIDASQAATQGSNLANLFTAQQSALGNNMQQRANTASTTANNAFSPAVDAYGNAGALFNNTATNYNTVGQDYVNNQNNYQEQLDSLMSNVGLGIAGLSQGEGGGTGYNPQQVQSSPTYTAQGYIDPNSPYATGNNPVNPYGNYNGAPSNPYSTIPGSLSNEQGYGFNPFQAPAGSYPTWYTGIQ